MTSHTIQPLQLSTLSQENAPRPACPITTFFDHPDPILRVKAVSVKSFPTLLLCSSCDALRTCRDSAYLRRAVSTRVYTFQTSATEPASQQSQSQTKWRPKHQPGGIKHVHRVEEDQVLEEGENLGKDVCFSKVNETVSRTWLIGKQ